MGRCAACDQRRVLGKGSSAMELKLSRIIRVRLSATVLARMGIIELIQSKQNAMTIEELATMLSQSPKTLYKAVNRGSLPAFRLGGSIRLDPHEVAEWLRKRRTK